jgi:hypothetical protein
MVSCCGVFFLFFGWGEGIGGEIALGGESVVFGLGERGTLGGEVCVVEKGPIDVMVSCCVFISFYFISLVGGGGWSG